MRRSPSAVSGWEADDGDRRDSLGARRRDSDSSSDDEADDDTPRGDEAEAEARPRPRLTPATTRDSHAAFRRFDTGGDGALSLEQIRGAVRELWRGQYEHEPALMRAYEAADKDRSGAIGRREFHLLLSNIRHFDELWRLFGSIDKGAAHELDLGLFRHACAAVGLADAADEFADAGSWSFEQFCDWMLAKKRQEHAGVGRAARPARRASPAREPEPEPQPKHKQRRRRSPKCAPAQTPYLVTL